MEEGRQEEERWPLEPPRWGGLGPGRERMTVPAVWELQWIHLRFSVRLERSRNVVVRR